MNYMELIRKATGTRPLQEVVCPPDKSVTHRAMIFSAMAHGESVILNPLLGEDCLATQACLQGLGVKFQLTSGAGDQPAVLKVLSPGINHWLKKPGRLDCGNSGTTARLLLGVLSSVPEMEVLLDGDRSLRRRPMQRVTQFLQAMGATISSHSSENGQDCLPLQIKGAALRGGTFQYEKASAQVKSALILAALNSKKPLQLSLPCGSRDHTELALQKMAAPLEVQKEAGLEKITVRGPFQVPGSVWQIPADPSSAAFWLVYSVISFVTGRHRPLVLRGIMTNPLRTNYLAILQRMGAPILWSDLSGDSGTLQVVADASFQGLSAVDVSAEEVTMSIDEIPILAVACAFAKGRSRFRNIEELRVKECDRAEAICRILAHVGGQAHIEGSDLLIDGGLREPLYTPSPLKTVQLDSDGDHRIAMAAAVLLSFCNQEGMISDAEVAAVSYPAFFEDLKRLNS